MPRKTPEFWRALLVSFAGLMLAMLVRLPLLGWPQGLGLSSTMFPAFIVATLYGGARWGWATLLASIAFALAIGPPNNVWDLPQQTVTFLFAVSGGITVQVASALRNTLVRLEEARIAHDESASALARSEATVRLAQEAGGVGFWDWDLISGTGYWSPVMYRNLGIDPSEPPSRRRLVELTHPDDRDEMLRMHDAVAATNEVQPIEFRIVRPDGQVRWLMSRGESLKDASGKVIRAMGVNIDVTERHMALERLAESEARFRSMADTAPTLMWVTGADDTREFVNLAYLEFMGVTYEEGIGLDWRGRLHADDVASVREQEIAQEKAVRPVILEGRYRRADGHWRWMRSVSKPRSGPDGAANGYIGIAFDVTDAKQAEGDLKRINDLLRERVDAALAERDSAQAQLAQSQKLEALGRLTGGVAHDFNNLLTVIVGALDIIRRRPEDTAKRLTLIDAALSAAGRAERLTSQLLSFSRRQPQRLEVTCVDDMLRVTEPLLRRAVGVEIAFEMVLDATDVTSRIDPAQMEAAVLNLLVNARDATPPGGRITLSTRRMTLPDTGAGLSGEVLALSVTDSGAGMDAETLGHAFEPFFTTKEVGKGTGLGLAQVYGFARQCSGVAQIQSRVGEGTTVTVLLPVSGGAADPAVAKVHVEAAALRPMTVLLVEDEEEVGDMASAMLSELGHTAVRASNAEMGLRIATSDPSIALVLTDVIMPGGQSGLDLAKGLRAARPDLPVILTSGFTGEALGEGGAGGLPFLRKPYSLQDLAEALNETVKGVREKS